MELEKVESAATSESKKLGGKGKSGKAGMLGGHPAKQNNGRVDGNVADNSGWQTVQNGLKKKAGKAESEVGASCVVKTSLQPEGWSVLVQDVEKMTAAAGVCYATAEQGKALMKELSNAEFPLAVVTLKDICEESAPLQVVVTNRENTCMKDCYLTKVGCSELVVSYTPPALRVSAKSKSCIAVLQVWQTWIDQRDWILFESNPRVYFVKWLS